MNIFSNIWNADHNFNDGNISIANTVSNLAVAYLETIVEGLTDSLASPILLGFLYQIDAYSKRSKPYPIVSQRQTINLDLSACASFLFVPVSRLIDDYTLKLYVSSESGSSESIDLSAYALIEDLPDFASFVTNSVLTGLLSEALADVVTGNNLDAILTDYVLTVDLPPSSGSSSENYIVTAINTTLESGKKYYASVPDLIFTLPVSPLIGEVINLSTGNHSLQIKHGNASQTILNSSVLTLVGSDNGIMLKPYSAIELVYTSADLWVSTNRSRTINNFQLPEIESVATQKNYTPTAFEAYGFLGAAYDLSEINDANPNTGAIKTSGGTVNRLIVLMTLNDSTILDSIQIHCGQFNGDVNMPTSAKVYSGNSINAANLLATFNNIHSPNNSLHTIPSPVADSVFTIEFISNSDTISVREVSLFGRSIVGGEVSVS